VDCPRFLFPFARRIIADATIDGGFPPFMLEPLDFAAVYAAQRAARDATLDASVAGNA
jgi:preprotein translocase subunit SecB